MRHNRLILAIPIGAGAAVLGTAVIIAGASSPPPWAQAKLEHQVRAAQERMSVTPATKPANPQPPSDTLPPVARPAGILDMRQAPFGPSFFLVENQYHGPLQGNPGVWWDVYAGGAGDPAGAGVDVPAVAIDQSFPDGADTAYKLTIYKLAGATGSLRIVDVHDSVVNLVDAAGQQHSFSLVQLAFMS